jgi:hypothetical protein
MCIQVFFSEYPAFRRKNGIPGYSPMRNFENAFFFACDGSMVQYGGLMDLTAVAIGYWERTVTYFCFSLVL